MTFFDQWADIYDWIYAWKQDDIAFYVEEAQRSGGPVLELGCGTGRVTIPIARAGIEVVGLDRSTKMLQVARRKAKAQGHLPGKLTWVRGDMRRFSLGRRFALVIIPFRGFLSLLTVQEQQSCLECVGEHLALGGRLIFDAFVPDLDMLIDNGTTPFHFGDVSHPEDGRRLVVWHQNRFDNHNQINSARTIAEEVNEVGEVVHRLYLDFQIRYLHRFEAQHLLGVCGFQVEELYGWFDRRPFDEESSEMVWVARVGT
ncbi:MAG: class I SAM-dependent methyltransferase [Chloroflexi bacterium]|nr:class I SAM-dependent methyltransferase [Chloroflexota bacterium]